MSRRELRRRDLRALAGQPIRRTVGEERAVGCRPTKWAACWAAARDACSSPTVCIGQSRRGCTPAAVAVPRRKQVRRPETSCLTDREPGYTGRVVVGAASREGTLLVRLRHEAGKRYRNKNAADDGVRRALSRALAGRSASRNWNDSAGRLAGVDFSEQSFVRHGPESGVSGRCREERSPGRPG